MLKEFPAKKHGGKPSGDTIILDPAAISVAEPINGGEETAVHVDGVRHIIGQAFADVKKALGVKEAAS